MKLPPGLKRLAEHRNKVCRLKKSLYGLKVVESMVRVIHEVCESIGLQAK